jgi:hypothetical protein
MENLGVDGMIIYLKIGSRYRVVGIIMALRDGRTRNRVEIPGTVTVKVKFTLERSTMAHRWSRSIALRFL